MPEQSTLESTGLLKELGQRDPQAVVRVADVLPIVTVLLNEHDRLREELAQVSAGFAKHADYDRQIRGLRAKLLGNDPAPADLAPASPEPVADEPPAAPAPDPAPEPSAPPPSNDEPRPRIRLKDWAKAQGKTVAEVAAVARDLKFDSASALSGLSEDEIRQLEAHFAKG
jgi:hypothetical protein